MVPSSNDRRWWDRLANGGSLWCRGERVFEMDSPDSPEGTRDEGTRDAGIQGTSHVRFFPLRYDAVKGTLIHFAPMSPPSRCRRIRLTLKVSQAVG